MFKNKKITILLPNKSIISGILNDINSDGSLQIKNYENITNIYNGKIML